MEPIKTIAFIDENTSYTANFTLKLTESPSPSGFKKILITSNDYDEYNTNVIIEKKDNKIIFHIKPKNDQVKIAFYLYKNNKRIDTQWYSSNFSYILDKNKYGKGKYKIGYFVIKDTTKNPSKSTKKESGYSKVIEVK
jgi:predicted class III extradiol MEMO1 family dioxygenase